MATASTSELRQKTCQPCEGGVPAFTRKEAEEQLKSLDGWKLDDEEPKIRRRWKVKDFMAGIDFLSRVAELAEQEQHHPDIHLTGYRHVTIELTTHAIDGLSENDFIVAAKIDELEIDNAGKSS